MPQRSGLVAHLVQDRPNGEGPQSAYLMLVAGTYRFGVGKKTTEADAYFKDNGSGVYIFDNDPAEEDTTAVYANLTVLVLNG